ncbi:hypothetical protein ACQPTN_24175 [Bradyrhizobium sp. 13971]
MPPIAHCEGVNPAENLGKGLLGNIVNRPVGQLQGLCPLPSLLKGDDGIPASLARSRSPGRLQIDIELVSDPAGADARPIVCDADFRRLLDDPARVDRGEFGRHPAHEMPVPVSLGKTLRHRTLLDVLLHATIGGVAAESQ